jgi:hypothetical protein
MSATTTIPTANATATSGPILALGPRQIQVLLVHGATVMILL